jgi:Ca2+-binding EF-hand superfamily protein
MGLCLLLGALAQDEAEREKPMDRSQIAAIHGKADANNDGKISISEVLTFAEQMQHGIAKKAMDEVLQALDTDENGKLSLSEFRSSNEHPTATSPEHNYDQDLEVATFNAADTDGDGELNLGEMPGFFYPETNEAVLDVIVKEVLRKDANGDGVLSASEFWQREEKELSASNKKDFAQFDSDHSGGLSTAEIREWESGRFHMRESMQDLFDIADKDGDKHVTADELHAAQAGGHLEDSDADYHMKTWVEHFDL